ncbi:MAG: hypothetical protein OEU54_07450 [Gemmatimonadota bacterium]|nr:hypothetical protein [Gemmatimonadota bacterium]
MMDIATLGSLTLRGTVVLGAAALLAWSLKKEAAGTRHILWTATFGLLLALPAASRWMPGWELGVLPATLRTAPQLAPGTLAPAAPNLISFGVESSKAGVAPLATGLPTHPLVSDLESGPPTLAPSVARVGPVPGDFPWAPVLWTLWGLGAAAALTSILVGHLRLRSLVRKGTVVRDPVWLGQVDDLRVRLGIDRSVALVIDPAVSAPMTGGVRFPVILLPDDATDWTPERRRVVLTHELVHIRRHDVLRQVVGRVALAAYWFHPLGWLASRQAAASRELACDEEVLAMGTRPSEYASLLLEMADRRAMPSALCLSMVQPSQLERRVMSILDPKRPHRSSFATGAALVALAVFGISAAVAQPVPAPRPAVPAVPPEPAALPVIAPLPPGLPGELAPEPAPLPTAAPRPHAPLAETMPEGVPEPVLAPSPPTAVLPMALPQEATCKMEGVSGSFRGTLSSDEGRTEISGTHDRDHVIQKYDDDLRLCMRLHGDVEMSDDHSSIEAIGSDGWVVLESEEDVLRRLVITPGSGGFEYDFSVGGRTATFDGEAREWRDAMLTVLGGYSEAMSLRGEQASLKGEIASHHGEVASMRGEIASHHGEVASLRGEIASEQGEIASLRGEMSALTAHARLLERERREAEGANERNELAEQLVELEDHIAELRDEVAALERSSRISDIEAELEEIDHSEEIAELEAEIVSYELQSKAEALEAEIVTLDAERRAEEIEARIEPALERLRRLSRGR